MKTFLFWSYVNVYKNCITLIIIVIIMGPEGLNKFFYLS